MNIQTLIPRGGWLGNGEYLIRCPFCGDSKSHDHLQINVTEGVFHCFFCGEGGRLQKLFRKMGIDAPTDLHTPVPLVRVEAESLDFSAFRPISDCALGDPNKIMAVNYLHLRGVTDEEIKRYDMRVVSYPEHKWYGRVILPVKESGKVVCVVGRAFLDFIQPKYLYPHRGETLLTAGECLYTPFEYEPHRAVTQAIVIVEGTFDAISVASKTSKYYPIALLGKTMKEPQLYKILKFDSHIPVHIMLDADATVDNLKIAKQLSAYDRRVYVSILKKGDPGNSTPEELEIALLKSEPFSFDLEMDLKLGRL